MNKKRNIFCVGLAVLASLMVGGVQVQASDPITVPLAPLQVRAAPDVALPLVAIEDYSAVDKAIDRLLKHIRNRERDQAFAVLSSEAQSRYGRDPRIFMNSVRLYHHALYDHAGYRLLEPGSRPVSTVAPMTARVVKIQLIDKDDRENLILIRLAPDDQGVWQVDGLTSVGTSRARDA